MKKKLISILILFLVVLLSGCTTNDKTTAKTVTQTTQVEYGRFDTLYYDLKNEGFDVLNSDVLIYDSNHGDSFHISIFPTLYHYNKATKILTLTEQYPTNDPKEKDIYEFHLDKGIVKFTHSVTTDSETYTLSFQYNITTEESSSFTSNFPESYQIKESDYTKFLVQFILSFNNNFLKPVSNLYLHEYIVQ